MNAVKTVLVMAVLAAVGYGVFSSIWKKPESAVAPSPFPSPMVQISGVDNATSASSGAAVPAITPPAPPVMAPSFGSTSPSTAPAAPYSTNNTAIIPGSLPSTAPKTADGAKSNPANTTNAASGQIGVTQVLTPPLYNGATSASSSPSSATVAAASSTSASQDPFNKAAVIAPPNVTATNPAGTASDAVVAGNLDRDFINQYSAFMSTVQNNLAAGKLADVLLKLTSIYEMPNLPLAQRKEIETLLDQLAGTVIYSRQHYLEPPYIVQTGDTLEMIAEKYSIPPQLIARINGIDNPNTIQPGRELKVIRGPFQAIVHLDRHELTLLVQGRYAGRFPLGVGMDRPQLEGAYTVREKTLGPIYHGPDGSLAPPEDPRNPLGKYWIGLDERLGLHGTDNPTNVGRDGNRGTICFGEKDIDDLFGILSVGSRVHVLR